MDYPQLSSNRPPLSEQVVVSGLPTSLYPFCLADIHTLHNPNSHTVSNGTQICLTIQIRLACIVTLSVLEWAHGRVQTCIDNSQHYQHTLPRVYVDNCLQIAGAWTAAAGGQGCTPGRIITLE